MYNTTIAALAMRWLTEEALSNPIIGGRFCEYAAAVNADAWLKFAAQHGRPPDDPVLALEAATELQNLVLQASVAHLDALAAAVEVRRVLGQL